MPFPEIENTWSSQKVATVGHEVKRVEDALNARIPTEGFQERVQDLRMILPEVLQTDPKRAEIVYLFQKALFSPDAPLHKHRRRGNTLGDAVKKLRRDPWPDDKKWLDKYFTALTSENDAAASISAAAGPSEGTVADAGPLRKGSLSTATPVASVWPQISAESRDRPSDERQPSLSLERPSELWKRTGSPTSSSPTQVPVNASHQPSSSLSSLQIKLDTHPQSPTVAMIPNVDPSALILNVLSRYIPCPMCFRHWVEVGAPEVQVLGIHHQSIIIEYGGPGDRTILDVDSALSTVNGVPEDRNGGRGGVILQARFLFVALLWYTVAGLLCSWVSWLFQ